MINRFCQGLCDEEAGQHTSTQRPATIEDALDTVRWFKHVHQAMYGKTAKKEKISILFSSHDPQKLPRMDLEDDAIYVERKGNINLTIHQENFRKIEEQINDV